MNHDKIRKHIGSYNKRLESKPAEAEKDKKERIERCEFYRSWDKGRLLSMTEEDLYEYISPLWAMMIWGNKHYVVDKMVATNALDNVRKSLADLVWGDDPVSKRWDRFRNNIKGMGPSMMTEILCHVHSDECIIWNRKAYAALNYLEVEGLPKHNYQLTGEAYERLCLVEKEIAQEMLKAGLKDVNLLWVDYFMWHEMQEAGSLAALPGQSEESLPVDEQCPDEPSRFMHNEIRDKLADIGQWLGFEARTEVKVAEGARVDTIWEATIGNMGRVLYVFEVQTKGSIDSLLLNLLKAINNPAVQGLVAVSDAAQLEKIRRHASHVGENLQRKLREWEYEEVLKVHEQLESVNEAINRLGLVPQGF